MKYLILIFLLFVGCNEPFNLARWNNDEDGDRCAMVKDLEKKLEGITTKELQFLLGYDYLPTNTFAIHIGVCLTGGFSLLKIEIEGDRVVSTRRIQS